MKTFHITRIAVSMLAGFSVATAVSSPANATVFEDIGQENVCPDSWESSKVYDSQGLKVLHDGLIYTSQWWTQGNTPNPQEQYGAWQNPVDGSHCAETNIPVDIEDVAFGEDDECISVAPNVSDAWCQQVACADGYIDAGICDFASALEDEDTFEEVDAVPEPVICDDDFVILNQEDMATLKGCTVIEGTLRIGAAPIKGKVPVGWFGTPAGTKLRNLDGLFSLVEVSGDLVINYNDALTNIAGVSNLTTVGGYLSLHSNDTLTNIDGLSNLTSVGGYGELYLHNNPALCQSSIDTFLVMLEGRGWSDTAVTYNNNECD